MLSGLTRSATTLVCIAGALTGCGRTSMDEGDVGIPNPASEHCLEQGGQLDLREGDGADRYGVCVFEDSSECEEWAFYRGECEPGGG